MPKTVVVVPCYNEAERLNVEGFRPLLAASDAFLLFVDDGSSDDTYTRLELAHQHQPDRIGAMRLPSNRGKAEAVRQGMLSALAAGAEVVGYLDADLSTPAAEMLRLVRVLRESGATAVLGARVQLLGHDIERKALRHYLGRVFGTAASLALRLPVYDTQCGAKLFRDSPALRAGLAVPFRSRWAFDVELIGRLLAPPNPVTPLSPSDFLEVPLQTWKHVPGSKLRPIGMLRAGLEVIAFGLRRRNPR